MKNNSSFLKIIKEKQDKILMR